MAANGKPQDSSCDEDVERVAAAEAQRFIGELMKRVEYGGERLVITRRGKDAIAWVSMADLDRLIALQQPSLAR